MISIHSRLLQWQTQKQIRLSNPPVQVVPRLKNVDESALRFIGFLQTFFFFHLGSTKTHKILSCPLWHKDGLIGHRLRRFSISVKVIRHCKLWRNRFFLNSRSNPRCCGYWLLGRSCSGTTCWARRANGAGSTWRLLSLKHKGYTQVIHSNQTFWILDPAKMVIATRSLS